MRVDETFGQGACRGCEDHRRYGVVDRRPLVAPADDGQAEGPDTGRVGGHGSTDVGLLEDDEVGSLSLQHCGHYVHDVRRAELDEERLSETLVGRHPAQLFDPSPDLRRGVGEGPRSSAPGTVRAGSRLANSSPVANTTVAPALSSARPSGING